MLALTPTAPGDNHCHAKPSKENDHQPKANWDGPHHDQHAHGSTPSARSPPLKKRHESKLLLCNACDDVLRNAVAGNCCGAEWCEECAKPLSAGLVPCAICGAPKVGEKTLSAHFTPLRATRECVDNQIVQCAWGKCGASMARKDLAAHQASCEFAAHACPEGAALGCEWRGTLGEVEAHKEGCVFHQISGLASFVNEELGEARERLDKVESTVGLVRESNRLVRMTTKLEHRKNRRQLRCNVFDMLEWRGGQGEGQGDEVLLKIQEERNTASVWVFRVRMRTTVAEVVMQAEARRQCKFALSFGAPLVLGGQLLQLDANFYDQGFQATDFCQDRPVFFFNRLL